MIAPAYTVETTVHTPAAALAGSLTVPQRPIGMVAFAHGSGSSRISPRNRAVAAFLHQARRGTLLLDLLSAEESRVDEVTAHLFEELGAMEPVALLTRQWFARPLSR